MSRRAAKKPAECAEPGSTIDCARMLSDPGRRGRECRGELGAQPMHDRDNGNGNACGNEAILNSGGARLVFEKLHEGPHLQRLQIRLLSEIEPPELLFCSRGVGLRRPYRGALAWWLIAKLEEKSFRNE